MSLSKQEFNELVAKAGAGTLTDEEAAALEPYRSRNAIILVAGVCRRCAPISYDYPKPLIEVRGERLIERQIRQLLSVGITDITLVVGHMKEHFDYLTDKYGVKLVESPEYMVSNNIVSLAHAADRLGNTYILLGDQYFTVNPFERYVFRSFYATTLTAGDDVWVMETNPDGIVTDMVMREDGGEKLQGPCYVDAETGAALAAAIVETIADTANADKTWEYAWYLNRDKLSIVTRYYPEGVVNSFKSMDDILAFDDSYLLHVDSQAIKNICGVLECKPEDLSDFVPLLGGNTNFSVAFNVGDARYVYRHPYGYTPMKLDRRIETIANQAAHDCGVDPTFIYEDPEVGWKLCHFINNARIIDVQVQEEAFQASKLLGKFQAATKGITVDATYDRWDYACQFEDAIYARNYKIDDNTASYRDRMAQLVDHIHADNFPMVLSHNDSFYENFLMAEDGSISLIDWEFAAMADWLSDVANHTEGYFLAQPLDDRDFIRKSLLAFLGRDYTFEEWRHFMGLVMIRCWWVCMYAINFVSAADMSSEMDMSPWLGLCWTFFDLQLGYSNSLYEDEEAIAAEKAYMADFLAKA